MDYKVGQKVRIKAGTHPQKYAGTTQEIASVDTKFFKSAHCGYRMVGLSETEGAIENVWKESELEPAEETMDLITALKLALDGHKVSNIGFSERYPYVGFDRDSARFYYSDDPDTTFVPSIWDDTNWRIYQEPKVQPKFTIGSSVVYRSNRLATVVKVSDSAPYVYTLNVLSSEPNCTFEKTEDELREAK